jgi:type II secretory pathway pseudopilin PulG
LKYIKNLQVYFMKKYKSRGFALLETFIAMTIITILLSSLVIPGLAINNYQKRKTTHNRMQHIQNALNNYLETYGRLPCPINPSQSFSLGYSESLPTACNSASFDGGNMLYGSVPVDTLNITREYTQDGWGNKIMYVVPTELTYLITGQKTVVFYSDDTLETNHIVGTTLSGTTLSYTTGNFSNYISTVYKDALGDTLLTSNNIYLLLSYGDNGLGAYTINGTQNGTAGIDVTIGEEQNILSASAKAGANFYTNPSSNLRGGKLDDIIYTASISSIVSSNSSLTYCDYQHTPFYANTSYPSLSPAHSQSPSSSYSNIPHYAGGSLVEVSNNCSGTCPTVSGNILYTECLKGGRWGSVIARACTC